MMSAPGTPKKLNIKELVRRWDWLLTVAIAPVILFLGGGGGWALLVIPVVLVVQGIAWGEVLPVTPLNLAILVLVIMVGVSILVTPDLTVSLGKIAGLLYGIAVYFCVARHTRTRQGWRGSLVLYVSVGIGVALVGLAGTNWFTTKITGLNSLTSRLPVRLTGLPGAETGIHPNELAGTLLWVIPVILLAGLALVTEPRWFIHTSVKEKQRFRQFSGWAIFLTIAFLMTMVVLVLSQSRGAYLAILISGLILVIMILRRPARYWVIGLLAVDIIAGMILVQQFGWEWILNQVIGNLSPGTSALSLDSLNGRIEIWSRAIWAIQDVPLTGLGMNVFRNAVYLLYPMFQVSAGFNLGHAHNELLQVALDLGLPGLVGFVALYIGAFGMLIPAIRSCRAWRFLALGLLGGLLAHLVFGITDAIALGAKPGFLFWWLLGMVFGLYDQNRLGKIA
jgi:putative inorganic carbon (HCO3(-)) transporter